jgi:hypothetical protein
VQVLRDGTAIGTASVSGTTWTFTLASDAPEGVLSHAARIVAGSSFSRTSNVIAFTVDATPPAALASVTGFDDEGLGAVPIAGFASDTTPTVLGTISAALGNGENVQVLRNGSVVGQATVSSLTWSFTEPAALAGGTYSYQARAIDAANNTSATSAAAALTIVTSTLPNATITNATVSGTGSPGKPNGTSVASGGAIPDATPTLTITLSAPLQAGYQIQVFREDGSSAGTLNSCTSPCSFTVPAVSDGTRGWRARTVAGAINGTSSALYSLVVDTAAPTQTVTLDHVRSNYSPISGVAGAVPADAFIANGGQTNDSTPVYRFHLSAAVGSGESVQVRRSSSTVAVTLTPVSFVSCGFLNCFEFEAPTALTIATDINDPADPPANSGVNAFQSVGTASFTIRVVDQAGNESGATSARSVNVGYFFCDQNRANATYNAAFPNTPPDNHPVTISAAASPGTRCSSCHTVASGHPASPTGTPAGHFIAVPSSAPTYWCRRPF